MNYHGTAKELLESWCVYEVCDNENTIIYLGMCETRYLFLIPDLAGHAELDPNQEIKITMLEIYLTKQKASKRYSEMLARIEPPPLNFSKSERRKSHIRCVETGEIFKNQAEVCRAHDIKQSNLCKHMKKMPKYETVGGYSYEYL